MDSCRKSWWSRELSPGCQLDMKPIPCNWALLCCFYMGHRCKPTDELCFSCLVQWNMSLTKSSHSCIHTDKPAGISYGISQGANKCQQQRPKSALNYLNYVRQNYLKSTVKTQTEFSLMRCEYSKSGLTLMLNW